MSKKKLTVTDLKNIEKEVEKKRKGTFFGEKMPEFTEGVSYLKARREKKCSETDES